MDWTVAAGATLPGGPSGVYDLRGNGEAAQRCSAAARPGPGLPGQSVWVTGHSDQIATPSVSRASQPSSASVRPASPTSAIAATSKPQLIAHASSALPNSRHSWRTRARHYFATHSELLAFAMELVVVRVTERLTALPDDPDPRSAASRLLLEVLPLDREREAEMRVWLAFTTRALVDPGLRVLRDEAHAGLRELCRRAVDLLDPPHPDREAERLHALIDGLALHAVLDPEVTTPERQAEVVAAHLAALGP